MMTPMNHPPSCPHGPAPSFLQAATALCDALLADGLSIALDGRGEFGVSSGDPVAAVIDLYRAVDLDTRPDVIDLHQARERTARHQVSTRWMIHRCLDVLREYTRSEPVFL